MYTLLDLESKTFGELKKIGHELNVLPDDRRRRQSWIEAIVGVNPPLLQLLEVPPAASVDPVSEAIEVQATEPPIESKFGRIVYPRPAKGAIAQEPKTATAASVEQAAPEPIIETVEYSPAVEVEQAQDAIVQAAENSPGVEVDQLQERIEERFHILELQKLDEPHCPACGGIYSLDANWSKEYAFGFWIISCLKCDASCTCSIEELPRCFRDDDDDDDDDEDEDEDEFGFVKFCQCETEPKLSHQKTQRAIAQATKNSPAVEVDQVQDIINETWTSWEKEYCAWLADAEWCIYQGENKRIEKFLPVSKTLRLEGMKEGAEYCAIWEVSQCDYDFSGFPLPVCSSIYARELIAQVAENSPGVEVDPFEPKCSECFDDGFIEDQFGRVIVCRCNKKPLSRQKTQSAIAAAAKDSPGVEVSFSDRSYWADRGFFLIPEAPAVPEENSAVEMFDGCIYCTSPEYALSRDKAYRCYICEPPDQNPILTGITLSERFLARYAPPQSEIIHFQPDADGQLSLLNFEVESAHEPPDPDDFKSLDAFREAIAQWDAQNPEPPAVSMDSMCEWAPCPDEWYEPKAQNLPLKAPSMIELPEQSEVMELPPPIESSITSDFFIPTFGAWCDRLNGSDEPPDTGIFARLPKPKPPKFPPQVSQPQVSPSQAKSAQVNQASRNYPETIPKLFHRVAAGTSNQPARSPPGGDA